VTLDVDSCYRAFRARDARFDGRFFVGVSSTGIYCRPICPVVPPKRAHVRFYPTACEAERAGLRPCKRCRPESAPGTPAWQGSAITVGRALRMIEAGELDGLGLDDFAERLGVGPRQLRRLFVAHLGVPPLELARARRTHAARRLIDESALPMSRIAGQVGFKSLRQFNAAIRDAYGRSPSELRSRAEEEPAPPRDEPLRLRLSYRTPFAWAALLAFLAPRAIPGVESVEAGRYRRTLALGGRGAEIRASDDPARCELELEVDGARVPDLLGLAERARRAFDLRADPARIALDLGRDESLAPRVRSHPGLRIPGCFDPFELSVRAVLGQQVSVAAATTLAGRLVRACGTALPEPRGALTHLFPEPAAVARAKLESLGLTRARAATLRALAEAVASSALALDAGTPLERAREGLRALPGIGPWTVEYIAMRALGDPDAFPASDLGLRSALARDGARPAAREVEVRAESWRPWRAYAALHLWTGGFQDVERS
jgi:AraC family transcriptional regulator of adaptative response / DNA-3-methyladenine glycosylase II